MHLVKAKKPEAREFGLDITNKSNKENLNNLDNNEEFKNSKGLSFKEFNKNHELPYLDDIFGFLRESEVRLIF